MSEEKFRQLLKKLKIAENKSYEDIIELLDARLDEYLDRQDEPSQEIVSQIHDALDYAEEMQKEVGSGITIYADQEQNEEPNYEELKNATNKEDGKVREMNAAPDSKQGQKSDAGKNGKLWFVSITGAANVDNMFLQAEDDLKYAEWQHAMDIFEMILQVEANNPSAYLGKALAENQLSEPRKIGSCLDKPLDNNVNLRRAFDHGNNAQKKYIQDALSERENALKYKEAEKAFASAKNVNDFQNAASMFSKISYYRDAAVRADQCRDKAKSLIYQQAESLMRQYYDNEELIDKAIDKYSSIKDYKDSREKIQKCQERKKEILYLEGSRRLRNKENVVDIRIAISKLEQIKGYKDAEKLWEECLRLIPEMEGLERKNKDVKQFNQELSRAEHRMLVRSEFEGALSECESVYRKVKEIKENKDDESHFYEDVDLKEWDKSIKAVRKKRKAYFRKERNKDRVAVLLVIFTFLLGPIWVNNFEWTQLPGFLKYLPISYTSVINTIEINNPPAIVFSLVPGNIGLSIKDAARYKYRIMPFANITRYCIDGTDNKDLDIPETAQSIWITDASQVESVLIPEGAERVGIRNCPKVKQVSIPCTMKDDLDIEDIGENARISFMDENGEEEGYMQGNCRISDYQDIYFRGNSDAEMRNVNFGEDKSGAVFVSDNVERVVITDSDIVRDIYLYDASELSYIEIRNCNNLRYIGWPNGVDLSTIEIHVEGNPILEDGTEEED